MLVSVVTRISPGWKLVAVFQAIQAPHCSFDDAERPGKALDRCRRRPAHVRRPAEHSHCKMSLRRFGSAAHWKGSNRPTMIVGYGGRAR